MIVAEPLPVEAGRPGDGSLLAVHGGAPPTTEVLGGLVGELRVIEGYGRAGVEVAATRGRFGDALLADGVTIWLRGRLLLPAAPTPADYATLLARWTAVRAKLRLSSFELFTYYHPAAPAGYRKYKAVNCQFIQATWTDPTGLPYVIAAVTSDATLYETGPGL